MTADSIMEAQSLDFDPDAEPSPPVPESRLGIAEVPVLRGIIDVTMVGLLGGGPRLAIRAARVMLQDSYESRPPTRQVRGRRPWHNRVD